MSVTSPHTIHDGLCRSSLAAVALGADRHLPECVLQLLGNPL